MDSVFSLNDLLVFEGKTRHHITDIFNFLTEYFWIYRGHMTQLFSQADSPLHSIPQEWKLALLNLSYEDLNRIPFGECKADLPKSLQCFLDEALRLGAPRFHPYRSDAVEFLTMNPVLPSSLLQGMTPKKIQEVVGVAKLVADVCNRSGCDSVLDVGAGIGYLDQVLHCCYGIRVLGVDSKFSHQAQNRNNRLPGVCSLGISHVPFTVNFSDENLTKLRKLILTVPNTVPCPCWNKCHFSNPKALKWAVVALHACGDLTNYVLRFYNSCPEVSAVVCVGCCYHKMSKDGFPISQVVKECLLSGGRSPDETDGDVPWGPYGLRLASQGTRARWFLTSPQEHKERATHFLFRATLEHALQKEGLTWKRPKRRLPKSVYTSFHNYCQVALVNYDDTFKMRAEEWFEQLKETQDSLERIAVLQCLLQPVLESLILLDRLCFMRQGPDGASGAWIQGVADESVSPRNLALVSIKNELCSQNR